MANETDAAFCALPGTPASVPERFQDTRVMREIVQSAHTIAIVGLSPSELRASYFVGFYLQRHGYRIVPVNPNESEILGETSYPSLTAIPFPADVVDVFRKPSAVPAIPAEPVPTAPPRPRLHFAVSNLPRAWLAAPGCHQ